ncbi:hypothetical protein K9L16_02450 [Candidatus Pacearchaeota archaeon]|nr:hypothetical protein [Candidatus Pacearchaeota archaeon]
MNLKRKLNHKANSLKMIGVGIGGLIINEIAGIIMDEPKTTYESSKLPKGYVIKGFGHLTVNQELINKSRSEIENYRSRKRIKQEIFSA